MYSSCNVSLTASRYICDKFYIVNTVCISVDDNAMFWTVLIFDSNSIVNILPFFCITGILFI